MKSIKLLNKISAVGLDCLDKDKYTYGEDVAEPCGILVRSADMHGMEHGKELLAVARAGAGVNNIPVNDLLNEGVAVFNTPGANANGVKELAICAILLASRDIIGGTEWVKTLGDDAAKAVEKGKSAFAGCEIKGKTLGVIGLGAIGALVANAAIQLGMKVIGCDPFLSVDGAWNLDRNIIHALSYDEIYEKADYITLHVPATADTKGMICNNTIAKMKKGVKIINLSRADLVNASDLISAIDDKTVSTYVTDFPTPEIIGHKGVVAIPHLGASTEESEDNCAVMAVNELTDYIENGNVKNSVNLPNLSSPRTNGSRICVIHKNVPEVLSKINEIITADGAQIANLANKVRGDAAYTIVDLSDIANDTLADKLAAIENVIGARVINE